jgi:hypothetical protein
MTKPTPDDCLESQRPTCFSRAWDWARWLLLLAAAGYIVNLALRIYVDSQ